MIGDDKTENEEQHFSLRINGKDQDMLEPNNKSSQFFIHNNLINDFSYVYIWFN